jgi:hypothetical protein
VADCAQKELAMQGAEVTRISLADYPLPIMDEDLEREKGIPENAYKLARLFASHDALLICTPEYNGSIPPLLKNTIDWVSRISKDNGGRCALSGQDRRHLLVVQRPFRRHSQRQPSARRAVAYPDGGDRPSGIGAQWRRSLRRGRRFPRRAAAQGHAPALPHADRACDAAFSTR